MGRAQVDVLAERLRQSCSALMEAEHRQRAAVEDRRVDIVLNRVADVGLDPSNARDVALCVARGSLSLCADRPVGRPADKAEKVFLVAGMVEVEELRGRSHPEAVRRTAQLLELTDAQVDKATRKTLPTLERWFPDLSDNQREVLEHELTQSAQAFVVAEFSNSSFANIGAPFRRDAAA